jgi:hypothetical protein
MLELYALPHASRVVNTCSKIGRFPPCACYDRKQHATTRVLPAGGGQRCENFQGTQDIEAADDSSAQQITAKIFFATLPGFSSVKVVRVEAVLNFTTPIDSFKGLSYIPHLVFRPVG